MRLSKFCERLSKLFESFALKFRLVRARTLSAVAGTSFTTENQRSMIEFLFLEGNSIAKTHRQLVNVVEAKTFTYRLIRLLQLVRGFKDGDFDESHRQAEWCRLRCRTLITEQRLGAIVHALLSKAELHRRPRDAHCRLRHCLTILVHPASTLLPKKTWRWSKSLKKMSTHKLSPVQWKQFAGTLSATTISFGAFSVNVSLVFLWL